jgi:hypothetical protein
MGWRTVWAKWADRPGSIQWWSEVCSLRCSCTFVLWTVRSPDQRRLLSAQSLYYCADRPAL